VSRAHSHNATNRGETQFSPTRQRSARRENRQKNPLAVMISPIGQKILVIRLSGEEEQMNFAHPDPLAQS
jgi:hypothetical protein